MIWDMKSFLLRFKGTIFASAQIQKITVKMSEKIMIVVYVYGPFDRVWAEEPPWDFHGLKNTCPFTCLQPTTKSPKTHAGYD